jgi:hypothetical protein
VTALILIMKYKCVRRVSTRSGLLAAVCSHGTVPGDPMTGR